MSVWLTKTHIFIAFHCFVALFCFFVFFNWIIGIMFDLFDELVESESYIYYNECKG